MTARSNEGVFAIGDYTLQSGDVIPDASIVWKTHGTLSAQKDNVILYPTSYSATHGEIEWLIGPDGILDPTRWFVIIPNMFGNGLSSSPSNTANYPSLVTTADNVHAQRQLLLDVFGVERLAGVYGWSMGAQQAYHWAALYPTAVERIVVVCGSARTAVHNQVFLLAMAAILESAPEYLGNGRFSAPPIAALRAFGRSYASWALSQDFYRAGLHLSLLGASSLDDFLRTQWEGRFTQRDAANLYAQLQTWRAGDISANAFYNGDLTKALGAIKAHVLLMPSETDLYFRVADNEAELPHLSSAELAPIPSIWGHRAGNPDRIPKTLDSSRSAFDVSLTRHPVSWRRPVLDSSLFIAGAHVGASNGATFERRNPLSGEVATRASAATTEDARRAVDAAAAAFPAWAALGPSARRTLLLAAAQAIEARAAAFEETMAAETGASGHWAHFNVHLAAGMLIEAASLTTQIGGDAIPSDTPGSLALALRRPAGVVLGIAPWNAPVILGVRAIAVPLACGNTVVLKGSELCPASQGLVVQALHDAGLPAGVVNYVTNAPADAPAVVDAMIAHPAVRRVSFTGSTRVGKIVAGTCAKYLKPVLLELGGKAPLVILDDADLEAAVSAAVFGAFANSGQICMSTERIIVDASIADAFVARFAARAVALPMGDPRTGPVVLGSVIDTDTVERCNALIDDAIAHGAVLVCGGKASSTLMPATVLDRVTPAMRVYHEESFGPVKSVVRVSGVDEAVATANDTEYGLSAAVFGRDVARAWAVAQRIDSGMCHINGPTVHDEAQMPFGGVKGSGYGRFGGQAGIDAFTDLRWITVQTTPRHYPF